MDAKTRIPPGQEELDSLLGDEVEVYFVAAIRGLFPDDIEDVDVTDSGRFRGWFEELREAANLYWENEPGNSAHVDIERVADEFEDLGQLIEAAEKTDEDDGAPAYGFKLDLIRRISYLSYCQTCGLLVSNEDSRTRDEALRRDSGHGAHQRLALQRVVYIDPEAQP